MNKSCNKKKDCKNCTDWIFSCEGRKNKRNKDLYDVREIAKALVLIEHE